MTRFVVGWCIFLCLNPKFFKRDLPVVSLSSPAPLPWSISGSPEASWLDTKSPWYSQYFNRAVTLKTFQEDSVLLGDVLKLPRKRCSSWHDVLSGSQLCFLEWYKSTVARLEPEKAGSLIRSSACWTNSLVEMDDMSNVTVHLLPTWWQPENETKHLNENTAVWMIRGKPDRWTNVKTLEWEGEQDRMCIEPPCARTSEG